MSFVTGRWHQFAKSGFKRQPTEFWTAQWRALGNLQQRNDSEHPVS
jgi:hypothetical protein